MKKNNLKSKSQNESRIVNQTIQDPLSSLRLEIEHNIREVYVNKAKIEKLAKSTIRELMKIHRLSSDAEALKGKRNPLNTKDSSKTITTASVPEKSNSFGLEYELTNMKMIRNILNLATPFEEKKYGKKADKKPHKRPPKQGGKVKSEPKGKAAYPGVKILIVEDDRTTIKIISYLLEKHHYKVLSASDAEEGLKMSFKERPDLVLLDIMLPGMDGFQLLTKLKANQQTSRIPVIILSSLSGERDVLKGLEKGASDYILKPFSPQILFFKIKKLLAFQNEHITNYRNL